MQIKKNWGRTFLAAVLPVMMVVSLAVGTNADVLNKRPADRSASTLKKSSWTLGTGWFKPNEKDLAGAPYLKLGMSYRVESEAVLLEALYLEDDDTVNLPTDKYKQTIVQLAYKRYFCKDKLSLGTGLQIHHIEFGPKVKRGLMTVAGIVDYNITPSLALRLENSYPAKLSCDNGCSLKFGGMMIGIDYRF